MRVLFCAVPATGHIEPMVPLIRALMARGDQVAWAGATETHPKMQALGVQRCFEVGPGLAAAHADCLRRWPQAGSACAPAMDPKSFSRLFGAVLAPAMLDGLVLAIRQWAPRVVVSETGALAAPLACELTGCMQVTHGFGMPPPSGLLQEAADAIAPCWHRVTGGQPPDDVGLFRHLYLDIYPLPLQPPERVRTQRCQRLQACVPQRADPQRPPAQWSDRWRQLAHWPLVYLTFGTVVNQALALPVASAALAGLRARIVITVGHDGNLHLLSPLPPNVHVERFIAQADLLPHCDLVVSHGGSGTLLASLAHGLPQMVLPQGADQFTNALALETGGAGISLQQCDASAHRVLDAAQMLLDGPRYRRAATGIAAHMAAMPGADEVATRLASL